MEEAGLLPTFAAAAVLYGAGAGVCLYAHAFVSPPFLPLIVRAFLASLSLDAVSLFVRLVAVSAGWERLAIFGLFLRVGGVLSYWLMCALVANGYGICTVKVASTGNWRGLLLMGLTAVRWHPSEKSPSAI